ncbi:related to Histidinol-phosphatase [Saccharomycodes ludwigii]|uniref:Histidinol-phosphatase n=1 Tax=Saccharomycodes ludwigii TaxID=36035 RepID=A0A376B747_9ASCO|nr:related to Histidinol-phosphatase [Saccharomycodes ludwigii]
MYSHHSHSGDYIAHGSDPLDEIIARVYELNFHTYCLTEHMPRISQQYLYPEEYICNDVNKDLALLSENFEKYLKHASKIKNNACVDPYIRTSILIGMEVEGCDEEHLKLANRILQQNSNVIQFVVGSCHHVNSVPIDFDATSWMKALKETSNNNLRQLFKDYYNLQYKMLTEIKPLVVGHFDLIRLYLPSTLRVNTNTGKVVTDQYSGGTPVSEIQNIMTYWEDVKELIVRNLKFIDSYGGCVEINTSGLRKNLIQPYPHIEVANLVKQYCSGRFVLSDDAHSVSQVGTNYSKALKYITNDLKLDYLYYLSDKNAIDHRITVEKISIKDLVKDPFWSNDV